MNTETFKIQQWRVKSKGLDMAMFTATGTTSEVAMAIAVATFDAVTELEDEGTIRMALTFLQLNIADGKTCPHCGGYKVHDEDCPNNPESAPGASTVTKTPTGCGTDSTHNGFCPSRRISGGTEYRCSKTAYHGGTCSFVEVQS